MQVFFVVGTPSRGNSEDHHRDQWYSIWLCSNTGLSGPLYEQISIYQYTLAIKYWINLNIDYLKFIQISQSLMS